jgi:hypothetical protein
MNGKVLVITGSLGGLGKVVADTAEGRGARRVAPSMTG